MNDWRAGAEQAFSGDAQIQTILSLLCRYLFALQIFPAVLVKMMAEWSSSVVRGQI